MGASPAFKIYNDEGQYMGSCHEAEGAAALVSFYGIGSTIRYQHRHIVWREGEDGDAGESFDAAADFVRERVSFINGG